jgi:hypothetical protein
MGIGEPGGGVKDGIAEETVPVKSYGPEFCVCLEDGVFEGDNSAEGAAIKSSGGLEYGISETSLAFEYGTVEDDVGFEFYGNTVRLGPGPGKNNVFLKGALVKDYRLRERQVFSACVFAQGEFFGLEFFGGVKEAIYVKHSGYGALVQVDIVSFGKCLKKVCRGDILFLSLKRHLINVKVKREKLLNLSFFTYCFSVLLDIFFLEEFDNFGL